MHTERLCGAGAPCLNRNILECKLTSFYHTKCEKAVLIETYWNVNAHTTTFM